MKEIEKNRNTNKLKWQIIIKLKDLVWTIYTLTICLFSQIFLHKLWYFQRKTHYKIRPVILTCEEDIKTKIKFIKSYKKNNISLQRPIIFIDAFKKPVPKEYLNLLNKLNPEKIFFIKKVKNNRYDNIQNFAIKNLFKLANPYIDELMLFLEDDIIFSSKIRYVLKHIYLTKKTGFITLYSSFHGYFSKETNGLIQIINPTSFYGNQALLFPKKSVEILSKGFSELKKLPRGFDHQWANFLSSKGYLIKSTNNSYVQHISKKSRLGATDRKYYSKKFIK